MCVLQQPLPSASSKSSSKFSFLQVWFHEQLSSYKTLLLPRRSLDCFSFFYSRSSHCVVCLCASSFHLTVVEAGLACQPCKKVSSFFSLVSFLPNYWDETTQRTVSSTSGSKSLMSGSKHLVGGSEEKGSSTIKQWWDVRSAHLIIVHKRCDSKGIIEVCIWQEFLKGTLADMIFYFKQ